MARKIPKWIGGSVVVCCFWGCGTTPNPEATPDMKNTSGTKTLAALQDENHQLKQELENLQPENNPIKWIAKLDSENTSLRTELDKLEEQLNDLVFETGSGSYGSGDEENILRSSLVTEKQSLKEQVSKLQLKVGERTRKLTELKRFIQVAN